jgi:prolyl oligopeptidase
VVRAEAKSKDGTKVPLSILLHKGTKLDGTNPTILHGYGGFGISQAPKFGVTARFPLRVWLEQGGIFAIANLRGGSEDGEEWRKAGNLLNKQNVFDDFVACAGYLIDNKYTCSDKLGIFGASNGGLLMGAALTQQPELYRAVVAMVGLYDMLRFERLSNGEFNATEFGSVKNAEQFKALHAYSPFHRVKDGTAYPAVFLLAGANDGRASATDSWKMAARLQAATSAKRPILLWTSFASGHGLDSSLYEFMSTHVDVLTFLFQELGVKFKEK